MIGMKRIFAQMSDGELAMYYFECVVCNGIKSYLEGSISQSDELLEHDLKEELFRRFGHEGVNHV